MRRLGSRANAVGSIVAALIVAIGGLVPTAAAATPDPSNVVIVLDFSASILQDATTRNRFGAALERIAARVDETSTDLVAGDATVSLVQFATRVRDYPGCAEVKLLNSPAAVTKFSGCLRSVAGAYRKGSTSALRRAIGTDTNYVAAMTQAAKHLPADAQRPAVIFFTDGRHDVAGVPASRVQPARDQLFGNRTPFALLPVGMGLDPKNRPALEAGLKRLQIVKDMPACVTGTTFSWPQAAFETADEAGNAVAVALQDATCTFTVAPTPTPTPAPTPAAVQGIRVKPGDGMIQIDWAVAAAPGTPVVDYAARCRASNGDVVESGKDVSLDPTITITGLKNGTAYLCEVQAVGAAGPGAWTPAATTAIPIGKPPAPPKPSVEALNGVLRVGVSPPQEGVDSYDYECSADNGATWPLTAGGAGDGTAAEITNATNGVEWRCRAFAANLLGTSDPSPVSDAARPCGAVLECSPFLLPVVAAVGALLLVALLAAFIYVYRGRVTGYVVAVVDVVHTANVGHGSNLGIGFTRDEGSRAVTGIVAEKGRRAEIRIRLLRERRFAVRDKVGRRVVEDGEPLVVVDGRGVRHSLVLRAFDTNAASQVAGRR